MSKRQRGETRLEYLRRALVELDQTFAEARAGESWNAAVAAKAKAIQVRGEIDEIEQVQAARDRVISTASAEDYYDELLATVRALRIGAMAGGSHVAAVSALKLEGELVAQRASASDRASAANRAAMSDEEIQAELERLRAARGAH